MEEITQRKNNIKQVKYGAILSYLLIILNSIYSLVVTPYILGSIGEINYGTYKTIASLSTSLAVLDIGLGGTIMRYIAKYRADCEERKITPFIAMSFVEGSILITIICLVCVVIYNLIPQIYRSGLNAEQIVLAKKLFSVLSINLSLHILENILNGILSGFNEFTYANGLKLGRVIIRIVSTYVFLNIFKSALTLVWIDLLLTILLIVFESIYIILFLKISISFQKGFWNTSVFIESFRYTILLFLTSIAAQVNSNLDNVVIGAELGASYVTVYSMGLIIFGMFENISTSISGVMLPTVTFAIKDDPSGKTIQDVIIRAGRIQFILLGAVVSGFTILGKQFIHLWLKNGFDDVYIIVLILMYPSVLELCVNVCLSVLRAKNLLGFRTAILCTTTCLNAIITIVFVKIYGYYAAAIGTGLSFLIGSVLIMNIYYYKRLGFNMLKIYGDIFRGILPCIIISTGATLISSLFLRSGWLSLIINVLVYCIVYSFCLVTFGLSKNEINSLPIINRLKKEKTK